MRDDRVRGAIVLIGGMALAAAAACGSDEGSTFGDGGDAGSETSAPPGFGGEPPGPTGPFLDFPNEPIIVSGDGGGGAAPANAADLFAAGGAATGDGSAPCLSEPEIGSIVPKNWLRPRFRFAGAAGQNLFEIKVHADNQVNDLRVYTAASEWVMPKDMWDGLRTHSADVGITISVRGGVLANGAVSKITLGSNGPWAIAPVEAPGSIVYWRIVGGGEADLKGFQVGDESVAPALAPAQVEQKPNLKCVGCHISSPDGKYAVLSSDGLSTYGLGVASIEPATLGKKPPFMTALAAATLESYVKGISTVAAPFWVANKHLVLASRDGQLRWVNLDGTTETEGSGILVKGALALTGDTHKRPNTPNLSHDGSKVVYVSGEVETDGRPSGTANDLYVVPFAEGRGGAAAPLAGAATTEWNEYYPSFSPDDKLVAFDRIPNGQDPYASPRAEVYVIPAAGGTPQRLAANDPAACSGAKSPGVENSWPKWAPAKPAPETVNGRTYYWLVFSSTRFGGDQRQLFMAPVVVDASGAVLPYKAVYLWNQPRGDRNHTPAWDVFAIPPSSPK